VGDGIPLAFGGRSLARSAGQSAARPHCDSGQSNYSADEAEEKKLVHRSLRRRASARKRIGVSYRFVELIDPRQWVPMTVEQTTLPA
jgi:hypothetical protein